DLNRTIQGGPGDPTCIISTFRWYLNWCRSHSSWWRSRWLINLWSPHNDFVMNVAGFRDALESAIQVQVDADLVVPVASLPGLLILKLFAWADRKHEKRDAPDILKILTDYADAGNEDRLYADELPI